MFAWKYEQGNLVAPTMAESEEAISALVSMGFDRSSAIRALAQARNDINAAADLLLNSHSQ
jgi:Holliday junction resolvasome RuvABC DNA-binding subunit